MYAKGEKILFLYLIAVEVLFSVKVQCYNICPKKSLYLSFPNVDSRWSLLLQEFMVNPLWLLSLTWVRIHSNCHLRKYVHRHHRMHTHRHSQKPHKLSSPKTTPLSSTTWLGIQTLLLLDSHLHGNVKILPGFPQSIWMTKSVFVSSVV